MHERIDLDDFVNVSSVLTGFTADELRATGLVERYHAVLAAEIDSDDLAAFLSTGEPAASGELARALTHLWYLGVWPARGDVAPFVVSARAYAEGLVWKTFHGAPPGTAAPGFGSWAHPPRRVAP